MLQKIPSNLLTKTFKCGILTLPLFAGLFCCARKALESDKHDSRTRREVHGSPEREIQ